MNLKEYIESGIIESFLMGLASPEEMEEIMALRKKHPELEKAINELEIKLEEQLLSGAITPPAFLKENILQKLDADFIDISIEKNSSLSGQDSGKILAINEGSRFQWKYAAAAATLLFLANAIAALFLYNKYQQLNTSFKQLQVSYLDLQAKNNSEKEKFATLYQDVQLMQDSVMQVIKMNGVKDQTSSLATVYWNRKTKDVFLFTNYLPPAPQGKQYQLWAIVDNKPVDAGLISSCTGLCRLRNIPAAQAFAITLEPAGGSISPTLSAMFVMGKA